MKTGIEFKLNEDFLNPTDTIDSMIRHLELIKSDIKDSTTKEEALIASIGMRNVGLQTLNNLLQDYLKQHNIVYINKETK